MSTENGARCQTVCAMIMTRLGQVSVNHRSSCPVSRSITRFSTPPKFELKSQEKLTAPTTPGST